MTVVKLKTAGESVTMHVTSCAPATSGTYPAVVFTGHTGDGEKSVEVPRQAVDRQLNRIEHTMESIVGETVVISRDANAKVPSKPFWGITVANAGEAASIGKAAKMQPLRPAEAPQGNGHAETKQEARRVIATKYMALFDRVADHHIGLSTKHEEFTVDPQAINATASSIFIAWQKAGLL